MKCFKCDRCGAVINKNSSSAGHIAHRDLDAKKYFFSYDLCAECYNLLKKFIYNKY